MNQMDLEALCPLEGKMDAYIYMGKEVTAGELRKSQLINMEEGIFSLEPCMYNNERHRNKWHCGI